MLLSPLQDRVMFPRGMTPPAMTAVPRWAEPLSRPLDKGQVEAWWIAAPNQDAGMPAPAVIYFHGNAELIDYQDPIVLGYRQLGVSVLLVEYRGYGRSGGKPSPRAIREDAEYFYDELLRRQAIDPMRTIFHGRSLGGAAAADLANVRRPAALIVESTFTNVADMARRFGVPGFLIRNQFRTDQLIAKANWPMLIFHGCEDELVPVSHGRKLRNLARADLLTYVEYNCQHNDFPGEDVEDYWKQIEMFLKRWKIVRQ